MTGSLTLLSVLLGNLAWAQGLGESVDVELLDPGYATGSLPGTSGGRRTLRGTVRTGTFLQYSGDPLVLWNLDTDSPAGAVVADRWTAVLGGGIYLDERVLLEARLPTILQTGGELPELAADGIGLGDAAVRGQLLFHESERTRAGASVALLLPTSPSNAWMGEEEFRLRPGLSGGATFGSIEVMGDLRGDLRTRVDNEESFALGSRLAASLGVRGHLPLDLAAFASVQSRHPLASATDALSAEAIAGLQWLGGERLGVDLGAGTGLNDGYGTTALRVFTSLSWTWAGEEPEEPEVVAVVEPPPPPPPPPPELEDTPDPEEEEEEDFGWEEAALARVAGERIEIRDPIRFEAGTDRILPESLPVLEQVAGLLLDDPRIVHLVVEGHASPDGAISANYALSIDRARAVWERLITAGVHPDRLSYRGMGEAIPRETEEGQESGEIVLADSRRVELHIVRQLFQGEPEPEYRDRPDVPWESETTDSSSP